MATHFSILAWRIPWTEEPAQLQSTGSQTVRHYLVTKTTYVWCHCLKVRTNIAEMMEVRLYSLKNLNQGQHSSHRFVYAFAMHACFLSYNIPSLNYISPIIYMMRKTTLHRLIAMVIAWHIKISQLWSPLLTKLSHRFHLKDDLCHSPGSYSWI